MAFKESPGMASLVLVRSPESFVKASLYWNNKLVSSSSLEVKVASLVASVSILMMRSGISLICLPRCSLYFFRSSQTFAVAVAFSLAVMARSY